VIPKKIHYFWVGGKAIPDEYKRYLDTWKRYCPDYEIIRWNEDNYDITKNTYMREAYESKQWAFVPDYARLDIVHTHGGIYLDTDVELLKNLDTLLVHDAFAGFEDKKHVAFGLGFGAVKGHEAIKALRDFYDTLSFINPDGSFNSTPSPKYQTEWLFNNGLKQNGKKQVVSGITIFPSDYFSPAAFNTSKIKITQNSYSIHHFGASWFSNEGKLRKDLSHKISKTLPPGISWMIAGLIIHIKHHGLRATISKVSQSFRRRCGR